MPSNLMLDPLWRERARRRAARTGPFAASFSANASIPFTMDRGGPKRRHQRGSWTPPWKHIGLGQFDGEGVGPPYILYAIQVFGTFPPLAASWRMTSLWSQTFILDEPFVFPE